MDELATDAFHELLVDEGRMGQIGCRMLGTFAFVDVSDGTPFLNVTGTPARDTIEEATGPDGEIMIRDGDGSLLETVHDACDKVPENCPGKKDPDSLRIDDLIACDGCEFSEFTLAGGSVVRVSISSS